MPRPKKTRCVLLNPGERVFKPQGVPLRDLEVISLSPDEFEALRLADLEGLYHQQAGELMGLSRQTFGRILEEARRKVVQALIEGKALKIEKVKKGGEVEMRRGVRTFKCYECGHVWQVPYGTGRPESCPECGSSDFHRLDAGGGRCHRHRHRHQHRGGKG